MGNHTSDEKYGLSPAWSKSNSYREPFDYTMKSNAEQTVLIRRLDMGDLLKLGIAEQLDFMSKELMSSETAKTGTPESQISESIMKADNFEKMESMINKVVCAGVIMPKLYLTPEHEAARQKGLVYADSIPFGDRLELFSVIFESEGLTDFREEQEHGVADVANVPGVLLPTDGPVDIRSDDA